MPPIAPWKRLFSMLGHRQRYSSRTASSSSFCHRVKCAVSDQGPRFIADMCRGLGALNDEVSPGVRCCAVGWRVGSLHVVLEILDFSWLS